MTGVLIRRGDWDTDIHRGVTIEGQGKDSQLCAKGRGLRRN